MSDPEDFNYPTADELSRDFSGDNSDSLSHSSNEQTKDNSSPVKVPDVIGGYAIGELLGAGGMGQVFLAEHQRMKRIVAIKMLRMERMANEAAIEKFYDEVRAASRLLHPNIVTAFDAGESEGIHYLAMEYVDGETLTKLVANQGPLSLTDAADVIRQAARGLLHAHRAGIVHRDVKPDNLMRAVDGTIKILDLGLAQMSSAGLIRDDGRFDSEIKESRGRLSGTLPFMSPEQLEDSDSADARSDIYALGATMYFLLTGRPPYTGEFLDIIYGHRHGEIPDLMEVRDDTDMGIANIFNRMMAKSPGERYASLDEVIDDLSDYVSQTGASNWINDFTGQQHSRQDLLTTSFLSMAGSTSSGPARVLAIDFGMFYAATAEGSPLDVPKVLSAGRGDEPNFRMAVSNHDDRLIFGTSAIERRAAQARNVVHCLPMYIGKPLVEREIMGRQCPPEVLMALLMRRIRDNSWTTKPMPHATAITVPASYDQLHRRSILQAAEMVGMRSVRLVDRSIAAVQSLLVEAEGESLDGEMMSLDPPKTQTILFVGVTGQASEVSVIRLEAARLQQLSTTGHWHTGTLPWLQRLVDLAAQLILDKYKFDVRRKARWGARLQLACERAMSSLMLLASVCIKVTIGGKERSVQVERSDWLQACKQLAAGVRKSTKLACRQASISITEIDQCVTLGPLLRNPTIRDSVLRGRSENLRIHPMDRTDVARGAAACLAAELPGRRQIAKPPRLVTSQSIGIVVNDAKGRQRILPVIPKGTSLPARTNRRLTVGADRESMTLSLVESSGLEGDDWQSLGSHEFEIGESNARVRMIGFEINVNGMLSIRAQIPGTSGSTKLPPLPKPMLSDDEMEQWSDWMYSIK